VCCVIVVDTPFGKTVTDVSGVTVDGKLSKPTIVSVVPEKSSRRKMWRICVHTPPVWSPAGAVQLFSKREP